jgi:hypothetical protein
MPLSDVKCERTDTRPAGIGCRWLGAEMDGCVGSDAILSVVSPTADRRCAVCPCRPYILSAAGWRESSRLERPSSPSLSRARRSKRPFLLPSRATTYLAWVLGRGSPNAENEVGGSLERTSVNGKSSWNLLGILRNLLGIVKNLLGI